LAPSRQYKTLLGVHPEEEDKVIYYTLLLRKNGPFCNLVSCNESDKDSVHT